MTKRDEVKPRHVRFDDANCYFDQGGSGWMKLSRNAAEEVATRLLEGGGELLEIEGGIWRSPGFEMRLDAIIAMRHFGQSEYPEVVRDYFIGQPADYDTYIVTSK